VIGKIQGWTLPLGPFTATQLGVLVVGVWLLVQTWRVWSRLGPLGAVVAALPFAATWAVRHTTIDGRAPLKAVGGYAAFLLAPRGGWMHGRPLTEPKPESLVGAISLAPHPRGGSPRSSPHPPAAARPSPEACPRHAARAPHPTALSALLAELPEKE
jgi:hypothetical protein